MAFGIGISASGFSKRRSVRARHLTTAGFLALAAAAQPAVAQQATSPSGPYRAAGSDGQTVNTGTGRELPPSSGLGADAGPAANEPAADITVTGTRIVRDGYSAPTPVSVIGVRELKTEAPANVADFLNTLPSIRGSSTAANSSGSLSNGLAGIASVNLRALGANRTLVLFDGQRSVSSAATGVVDVNTFPQALIERVEVVTGGASSAYGSDAVAGVVNFILDKKYKGLKAEYEYGITTYGDGPNHKATLTGGMDFGGGRGHVLASGEYFHQNPQHSIDRDWNDAGFFQIDNPAYTATNGLPARLVQAGIGTSQFTPGGLIYTGALSGTYFGTINPATGYATLNNLAYGAINGQWMVGGDYKITREGHIGSTSLIPSEDRKSAFGRVSWEFSPAIEVFGQVAFSHYDGVSYYQQTPTTGVIIQRDNAYLPPDLVTRMTALNLTSVTIGTSNAGIPAQGSHNKREVTRYVAGANGDFGAIGRDWTWNAYYQKGIAKADEQLINTWNLSRMALATDAVRVTAANAGTSGLAVGSIACRSTLTAPTNGCVPINRIGIGGITPAALNYIFYGGSQPLRVNTLKQEVEAANLSTNSLFENWSGPVSFAVGIEHRRESISGVVDALYQPAVLANGTTSSTWIYGNYLPTFGQYSVTEGYVETVFPLFKNADLNGAFRLTDYSTSGRVNTWKIGATWQAIEDLKLRGTYSRDIRAPNLNELFQASTGRTNTVNVPLANGTQRVDQFLEQTVGNANLKPEIAKTIGAGVIVTPRFLEGFAASFDYYDIKLKGAINTYSAQTTIQLCYEQARADVCPNITTTAGTGVTTAGALVTGIKLIPFNYVQVKSRGFDMEASYRHRVGPGMLILRALGTHYLNVYTNNGIDFPTEAAGQNSGSTPDWTYRLTANYEVSGLAVQFTGRGVSSGVYDNSFIQCTSGCPVSTVQHRTINDNHIPGAFYLDFSTNYSFKAGPTKAQVFLSIRNILDRDPVLVGNGPTGNNTPAYPQTNRNLYDYLGRVFRMGLRVAY